MTVRVPLGEIFTTRLLSRSVAYILPAPSVATPYTPPSVAAKAGPPFPRNTAVPPAIVVMMACELAGKAEVNSRSRYCQVRARLMDFPFSKLAHTILGFCFWQPDCSYLNWEVAL